MTIHLAKYKLFFASAPKVACTSIKTTLFRLENSFEFQPFFANGVYRHIHDYAVYPAISFESVSKWDISGAIKTTMVRNPVERFLSAYSNRVLYYRELSADHLDPDVIKAGLTPDPSLSEFIDRIDEYRNASDSIRTHTNPLVFFLGKDEKFYDKIFKISQMNDFCAALSEICNEKIEIPRLQTGGKKISVNELSSDQVKRVENFYESDYQAFGDYLQG